MTGDPKCIAACLFRWTFGLSLLLVGVAHYMGMEGFSGMVAGGLGPLEPLGKLWAYLLPALQIVGGALLVVGKHCRIATWAVGLSLGSIAVGMLLKPLLSPAEVGLGDVMGMSQNALMWFFFFMVVCKWCCCAEKCDAPMKKDM